MVGRPHRLQPESAMHADLNSATLPPRMRLVLLVIVIYRLCGQSFLGLSTGSGFGDAVITFARASIALLGLYAIWPILLYCIFFRLRNTGERRRGATHYAPLITFGLYTVLRALIAAHPDVALDRLADLLLNGIPVALCAVMIADEESIRWFRSGILIVGLLFLVTFALQGKGLVPSDLPSHGRGPVRLGFGQENASTIVMGLLLGVFLLCAACVLADSNTRGWRRLCLAACMMLWMLADYKTGSRGPIVSLVITIGVAIPLLRISMWRKVVVLLLCISVGVITWQVAPDFAGQKRFQSLFGSVQGRNKEARSRYYGFALAAPPTVFGNGVGSFASDFGSDPYDYPHNLVLEVHYEHGLVGLGFLAWLLWSAAQHVIRTVRRSGSWTMAFCGLLLLYVVAEAQFSGTFWTNHFLVFAVTLVFANALDLRVGHFHVPNRRPVRHLRVESSSDGGL